MRIRILAILLLSVVTAGVAATSAPATDSTTAPTVKASLNQRQEIPKPTRVSASAGGAFRATLVGNKLSWTLTYAHLTGPVAATYLHYGSKTQTGTVLIPICTECRSPVHGRARITPAELKDLVEGKTYVNVDTIRNPRGEIRGQVK
jgi:hypothetical protein